MSVIGIDLDNTLARYTQWQGGEYVGQPDASMVQVLTSLFGTGHTICMWTTRPDYIVERWLKRHNLQKFVHHINCSPYPTESGKASFDFYIGDDAVRWNGEPLEVLALIAANAKPSGSFDREAMFSSSNPALYLGGVGRAYVDMFEPHWQRAWIEHDRKGKPIAFLTICSHAKPYSKSFIHSSIRRKLYECAMLDDCDYIHISNAGIVPASAEMAYPFNAYDWNGDLCSPEVRAYHMEAIERRLRQWLEIYGGTYQRVVVYLRGNGNTCQVVQKVWQDFQFVEIISAAWDEIQYPPFVEVRDIDDCLTSTENLQRLALRLNRGN